MSQSTIDVCKGSTAQQSTKACADGPPAKEYAALRPYCWPNAPCSDLLPALYLHADTHCRFYMLCQPQNHEQIAARRLQTM